MSINQFKCGLFKIVINAFSDVSDSKLRHHLVGELMMSFFLVMFMFVFKAILGKTHEGLWFYLSLLCSIALVTLIAWYKEYVCSPKIRNTKPDKHKFYDVLKGSASVVVVAVVVFMNCALF